MPKQHFKKAIAEKTFIRTKSKSGRKQILVNENRKLRHIKGRNKTINKNITDVILKKNYSLRRRKIFINEKCNGMEEPKEELAKQDQPLWTTGLIKSSRVHSPNELTPPLKRFKSEDSKPCKLHCKKCALHFEKWETYNEHTKWHALQVDKLRVPLKPLTKKQLKKWTKSRKLKTKKVLYTVKSSDQGELIFSTVQDNLQSKSECKDSIVANAENLNCKEEKPSAKNQNDKLQKILQKADDIVKKSVSEIPCETEKVESLKKLVQNYKRNSISKSEKNKKDHSSAGLAGLQTQDIEQFCDELVTAFYNSDVSTSDESHEILLKNNNTNITGQLNNENEDLPQSSGSEILNSAVNKEHPSNSNKSDNVNNIKLSLSNIVNAIVVKSVTVPSALSARTVTSDSELKETKTGNLPTGNLSDNASKNEQSKYSGELSEKYPVTSVSNNSNITSDVELKRSFQCGINNKPESLKEIKNTDKPVITNQIPLEKSCLQSENKLDKSVNTVDINVTESSLVSQTSSSASKNITGKNIVNREPIFQKLNSSQIKNNTVIRNSVFESNSNVNKNGNAQSATIADGSGKSASIQLSEDDRMVRLKAALQQAVNFPQHKCDVCHHSFKTKQALSRHKLSHLENTNYSCILCGRYFRLHSTLSRHMDSHRRMLYCDKCRTVFPSSEKFEAHLILHQNDLNSSEVPSASTGHSNYSTSMMNKAGANHSEEIGKADSANNSSNLESNRQISTSPGGQMQDVRPSIIQSANKTPPNVTKAVNISSKNDDDDDVILIASQPPGSARRPGTLNNDNTGVMPVIQNVCSAGIILTGEAANAQPKPQQNQQRPTLQQIQTQRQHYQHLQYQRQQQLQQQQQLQKQQEFHQQLQQQQLHQQQLQQQQHYQQQCQQQQQYQHQQHQQRQQQYQQQQQQYQQQLQYRQQQINSYQHQRQVGMQQLQHQQQQINNSNSQLMTLLSNPAVNQGNQSTEVSSQGPQNRNITVTSLEVPSGSHSGNVHRPGPVPTPLLRNKELTIMPLNPLENVNRTQNALTITPVTSQINPSISETNSPSHTSTSISITPVTTAREVSIIPMGPSVKSVIASNSAILHQSGNNSLNATNHRVQQVNPRMPAPPLPPLIPIPQTTRSVSITQISQQKDNPNCSNSIPQGNYANRIPVTLSNSANNARTGSNTNVSPLANRLHHIPVTYAQNRQNSHALMNSNNINNVSQKNSFSSNNSYMQNPSGMHLVSQSSSQMNNQKLNSRGDPESLYAGRYVPRSVDNLERPRQSLQQMSHIPQQMPNGIPRYPQDSNNQIRLSNYPTISTMSPPNVSISMNVPRPNLSQQVHPSQMDRYGRSLPPTLSSLNHFVQSHRPDGGSSHSGQGLISSCSQQQMAAYISNHKPYPIPPSLPPPPPYRMPFPPTSAASRMDNAHTNVSSPVVTRSNLLPYVEPITTNETSLGSLSQDVESLTCGICSSVFPDAAQLSSHLVTHTRDPSKDGEAHSPDVIFCSMEGTFDFTSINVKQEKDDKTDSPNEDVSNALTETMNDDISEVATTKKSFESVAEGTSKVVQTDNSEEAEISPPKENSSECSETKSTDNDAMECDSLVNTIDAKSNKILIKVIQSEMVEDLDEIDSDTDKLIGDTNVDSGIIMEKENNENLTPEKTQGSSHHSDIDQEVLISEETETILDETKMIGTNDIEIKEIENKDLEIKEIENKDLEGNEIVLNETLEYQDDEEELNADEMKAELNVSKSGSIYKESIIVSDKDENFDSNIPSPEEELELKMEEDSELWRETAAENKLPADCESGDTEKSSLPSSSNELLAYNSQWIEAARTAPKSLICPICDQTLPTILSFHRHLHQHKMLTRFFCRSCNLEFTTPEAYQEHKLLYHKPRKKKLILSPMVRKGQRKMSPFSVRCKLCQKKFNNFRLYQLHRSECERKTAELQNLAVPVIDLRSVASNADSLADIGISGFIPLYATSKINCAEEVNESPSSLGNSSSHLGIPLLDTNSIQTTNVQRLHELGIIRSLTLNAMHKLTDLPLVRSSTPVESLSSVPVPEEEHADTLTSQ